VGKSGEGSGMRLSGWQAQPGRTLSATWECTFCSKYSRKPLEKGKQENGIRDLAAVWRNHSCTYWKLKAGDAVQK
jgi:hypothetical protein